MKIFAGVFMPSWTGVVSQ